MQFLPGENIMQQRPYGQWQQPPWQPQPTQYPPYQLPSQVVFMPPPAPIVKPKNTTMKTLSIISFVSFAVLFGFGILASEGAAGTPVVGLLGCTGLTAFVAGFIFLCLI